MCWNNPLRALVTTGTRADTKRAVVVGSTLVDLK